MLLNNFYLEFPHKNSYQIIFFGVHQVHKYIAQRIGISNYIEYNFNKINIFFILRYILSIETIFLLINNGLVVCHFYCYIKFFNPKIVVTFYDNDFRFYCLKKYFKFTYFISIQNGFRGLFLNFFGMSNLKKISKKKNFRSDFLFVFNNYVKCEYQKYIETKVISCGSLLNNKTYKFLGPKAGIGYISQWRDIMKNNNYFYQYGVKTIKSSEYFKDEKIILPVLFRIAKEKQTYLKIIGCSMNNSKDEENYFFNKYPNINFKFIPKKISYQNYNEVDKCSLVVSIRSTLGYESLSRLNKTVILMNENLKLKQIIDIKSNSFGWPKKFGLYGLCHSNQFNKEQLYIFLNKVYDMDFRLWKQLAMPIASKVMSYDKSNKIIFETLNNILRGKIV